MLLVDAAQGIEAQTLANLYLAVEADLAIVPVINKIDLPAAQPDRVAREIEQVLGVPAEEMLRVSAKTGEGVPDLLEALVRRVPPPTGDPEAPARALVFDSLYDSYRGVIAYMCGWSTGGGKNDRVRMMAAGFVSEAEEVSVRPRGRPDRRAAGRRGRLPHPWVKDVRQVRVGDTATTAGRQAAGPLPGYREPRPMVFSACTRSRATTSPTCATPSTGCGSTTPPWSTSPSRFDRLGSGPLRLPRAAAHGHRAGAPEREFDLA